MQKKDNNNLLSPASAIENYFDNLLQEVEPAPVKSKPIRLKSERLILPGLDSQLANIEDLDAQQKLNPSVDKPQKKTEASGFQQAVISDRYDFPVQCLMFHIGKQQLSIPLIDMLSVISKINHITQIPQVPEWFLGLIKHRGNNIRVVDSASLLSIHTTHKEITEQHILVLKGASWGITCDRLGEVIVLNEEDVKWSGPEVDGMTLGTIKKSLAILLDMEKILSRTNSENQQNNHTNLFNPEQS